ncbi:MAG: hypothetical protein ACRD2N_18745 [Vicinamibacterales bacterium]
MRTRLLISGFAVAIAVAATMTTVSASDQTTARETVTKPQQESSKSATPSTQFATLKGIMALPMKPAELKSVKGLHIHFFVNGQLHIVNHQENNLGGGQAPAGSGPGYSGLCTASGASPAINIPPGQGC